MMESKGQRFDLKKSLKSGYPYPVLKYFRVEVYLTRRLSSLVVRALFKTSITPNQLTFVSFLLGTASGILFCGGSHIYFVFGGILIYLSSVFDCADGMLARAKNMCTRYGTYLDLFLDRIVDFILFSGINIGYFRYAQNRTLFIAVFVGLGIYFLQISLYYLIIAYKRTPETGQASEARGLTLFAVLVFALINHLGILLLLLLPVPILSGIFKFVNFIRMGREQRKAPI